MSNRPWIWKNLLLLAGGLAAAAFLLEGGARVLSWLRPGPALPIAVVSSGGAPTNFGPNAGDLNSIHRPDQWVWWRVKPGLDKYHVDIGSDKAHGFFLSTDTQGFRLTGANHGNTKVRILVVGDSTAMGVGANDGDSWPALLEEEESRRLGVDVEVTNTGVPGFSTFQAVRMAEKYGLEPRPNLVIACAGFNDSAPTPNGELPDLQRADKNEAEYAAGQTASQFLKLFSDAIDAAKKRTPQDQHPRLSPEDYKITLTSAEQFFAAQGIPLVWIHWPTRDEYDGLAPMGGYPAVLSEHCAEAGVRCVDLLPAFKALPESPYYDFVHATAQGNAAVAKALAAYLPGVLN